MGRHGGRDRHTAAGRGLRRAILANENIHLGFAAFFADFSATGKLGFICLSGDFIEALFRHSAMNKAAFFLMFYFMVFFFIFFLFFFFFFLDGATLGIAVARVACLLHDAFRVLFFVIIALHIKSPDTS